MSEFPRRVAPAVLLAAGLRPPRAGGRPPAGGRPEAHLPRRGRDRDGGRGGDGPRGRAGARPPARGLHGDGGRRPPGDRRRSRPCTGRRSPAAAPAAAPPRPSPSRARSSNRRPPAARASHFVDRLRRAAPGAGGGRARPHGGGATSSRTASPTATAWPSSGRRRARAGRRASRRDARRSGRPSTASSRASSNETVRDRMTDYEAMRIDRDRDPIVTDVVMRRFLDTGEILQDTASPRQPGALRGRPGGGLARRRAVPRRRRLRPRRRPQRAGPRRRRGARSRRSPPSAGRKSLVFASGGHRSRTRGSAIYRQVVSEARRVNAAVYFLDARGLSAAQAGMRRRDRDAHRVPRPRLVVHGGARAGRGQRGPRRRHRRLQPQRPERPRGGPRAHRPRVAQLLPARLRAVEPEGRRPLPHDRGQGRRARACALRARRGYYAPGGDEKRPAPAEGRDAAIQRALDAPFDLAGRAAPRDRRRPRAGRGRQGHGAGDGGGGHPRLRLRGEGRHGAGHARVPPPRGPRGHGRVHPLRPAVRDEPPPGDAGPLRARRLPDHARGAARRPGATRRGSWPATATAAAVGSLLHEFEVPDARGPARLEPRADATGPRGRRPGRPRAPEPTARRQFAASGILHCRFEVYGAATDAATGRPKVTAGFSIRRSDGKFLAADARDPAPGRPGRHARAQPRRPARRRASRPLRGDRRRHRPRRPARPPRRASRS